jgi:HAD superfamily hydrolase (TIGR01509 family)
MSTPGVEIVLFDLGGVLHSLKGVALMRELSGLDTDEEVWRRWLSCEWVRSFERGRCSAEEFAHGVVTEWELAIEPSEFIGTFVDWPESPFDGAEELVSEVKRQVMVGCLSNTNALHWSRVSGWPLLRHFDHTFLSFDVGMVKPDPEIFEHVANTVGTVPGHILFLDDNVVNVEGALAAGFQAAHVQGVDEARRALALTGLLIQTGER